MSAGNEANYPVGCFGLFIQSHFIDRFLVSGAGLPRFITINPRAMTIIKQPLLMKVPSGDTDSQLIYSGYVFLDMA